MKFSFDFDGTLLDSDKLQQYCQKMLNIGVDVYIITRRLDLIESKKYEVKEAEEVFEMADKLGIKKENIFFTNRAYKYEFVKKLNIDCHIDDDHNDVYYIRNWSDTKCIHFIESSNWEEEIQNFIEKKLI